MIHILAIESSCDETAAAVVQDGWRVKSNVISSQISLHQKYGGVVPEIASRKHIENIDFVIEEAMSQSGLSFLDIDAVAVTYGPGLVGALLVGLSAAKSLAYAMQKPLVGVNHIEGHICANFIENKDFKPPFICLVVSGGHTHLLHVEAYGAYTVLGRTRDDAAGEAYDKIARALGLGYPGGPLIDQEAKKGDPSAIHFPRAFMGEDHLDVSFSGLKSSVLNYLNKCKMTGQAVSVPDVAASFQAAVIDVLTTKTMDACKRYNVNKVAMAGGVASNLTLRSKMQALCDENGYALNIPSGIYCTDNAAMIGAAGYFSFIRGQVDGLALNAVPNLQLQFKTAQSSML